MAKSIKIKHINLLTQQFHCYDFTGTQSARSLDKDDFPSTLFIITHTKQPRNNIKIQTKYKNTIESLLKEIMIYPHSTILFIN